MKKLELSKFQEMFLTNILTKASQEAYKKGNQLNVFDIKTLLRQLESQRQS